MKSIAFDKKSVAFDTTSNGNYRRSARHHEEIARKSMACDKNSVDIRYAKPIENTEKQ